MDEVNAFFDLSKPFERINISAGTTDGRILKCESIDQNIKKRADHEEYSAQYLENEQQKLFEAFSNSQSACAEKSNFCQDKPDPVYEKYKFHHYMEPNNELPITSYADEILNRIDQNPVIVVQGGTGCGKSTQLPQIILEDSFKKKKHCNIIVTQPRRIAARSIAERVCRERKWDLGSLVGYQIALDNQYSSEDTRILFCTTGLLLEKLIQSKTMSNFTHIILDEVHERDKNMDFLFIVVRMLLSTNSPNVKVILMSATIEAPKFAEYFKMPIDCELKPAPIVVIDKKTQYSVKEFYLDDLSKINTAKIDLENPLISDELYKLVLRLVCLMKRLDQPDGLQSKIATTPSILIFLPGIYEISHLHNFLTDYADSHAEIKWKVLVLHSMISIEEQHLIFRSVAPDVRKIILSTNIAESSLTVPDVRYVIDFCLTKSLKTDSATNFTSLHLTWASRNHCRQRSGRAGRVMNGRCYRLIPRRYFEQYLPESATPEILSSPLENIVLKTKMLDMGPPLTILALAMDTPKLSDVANTILVLKELGALFRTAKNVASTHDGDITFLGRVMSNLPIDVRISRLILLGHCFGLLDDCIIMGAGLNVKSIFTSSIKDGLDAYSRKLEWSNGSGSDLFAILNAYKVWSFKHNQKEFGPNEEQKRNERQFGFKHSVDIRSLHDCHLLVTELKNRLSKLGIVEPTGVNRVIWSEQERTIILKVIIGGAFYPNFFLRTTANDGIYERDAYRELNGRNPYTTVFYSGFSQQYIRQLYVGSIKKLLTDQFADEKHVQIAFDLNSERVFVTFDQEHNQQTLGNDWVTQRSTIPGKIVTDVYKAVKLRKLHIPSFIRVLRPDDAIEMAEKLGLGFLDGCQFILKQNIREDFKRICMPRMLDKSLEGKISHVERCDRFWFQPAREQSKIQMFFEELNAPHQNVMKQFCSGSDIKLTDIVAARDPKDGCFYRARIVNSIFDKCSDKNQFTVFFIDFGHVENCKLTDLRELNENCKQEKIPARCFECSLAEIQPSTINTETNLWTKQANELFIDLINGSKQNVLAEIYSLVSGVTHVFIYVNKMNINDILIDKGFGEYCDETYMSKANHLQRQHKQSCKVDPINIANEEDMDAFYPYQQSIEVDPPPRHTCNLEVRLRGPFSPLETKLYSVMRSGASKTVNVDPLSVNSILLDTLQVQFEKHLVAAAINQSNTLDFNLIVRETTLLPNIRGIGTLINLLFCPLMEIKRDKTKSRYTSVITGLGYDHKEKTPIFEEHDCVFNLDFELTQDDLDMINQMRYCFDSLLYTLEGQQKNENISQKNKIQLMIKIKELIIKLLTKKRNAMELHTDYHTWNQYNDEDILQPESIYAERAIFPLHNTLKLYPADYKANQILQKHCTELHRLATFGITVPNSFVCRLCAIELENIMQLRIHMISRLHLDREKQIGFHE